MKQAIFVGPLRRVKLLFFGGIMAKKSHWVKKSPRGRARLKE
jgi:hypothetical protein